MSRIQPRILLGVTDDFSLRLLTGLPEKLAEDGWEVHVAVNGGEYVGDYRAPEVTIHEIPMARAPSLRNDVTALKLWSRLIRQLSPDLVFVGTPKAGLLGIVASWWRGVPARIYHVRGLRLETISGLKRLFFWVLEKIVFVMSTEALAVSPSLRRKLISLKLVAADKVSVVGHGSSNGIDTERFKPWDGQKIADELDGLHDALPVIGFVGRVAKDKGWKELLTASEILTQTGLKHQLLVVGPHEDGVASHNYPQVSVVYTGVVTDTAPYYKYMNVLCLPTYREGFPNVVLEAGASGVPVVTTDATGAVDSVIDDVTGKLVKIGDARGLSVALRHLLTDRSSSLELGKNARDHVKEHFSQAVVQSHLVKFLRDRLRTNG